MNIQIPIKENISPTNQEDPVELHYLPVIGSLYRKRLQMVLDMIGIEKKGKVLEIGYGSGILFLELSKRFDEIYGVDIHNKIDLVEKMLEKESIKADLKVGNILNLPYGDEWFDAIVCISVLEHISPLDLDKAVSEIYRVLVPGGIVVVGFPTVNKKMEFLFRAIGYKDINKYHISTEKEIMAALNKRLTILKTKTFPKFFPPMYITCKYIKEK